MSDIEVIEIGNLGGPSGPPGVAGPPGTAGVGVPAGGTTGQVLGKTSNADYVTSWQNVSGGGGGPTGPAGGSLSGTYPNPALAAASVANLDVFTSSLKGVTPASGGGTANFLRADGTWAAPAGSGGGGGAPSGPAGGVLTGSYPDPDIAVGAVTSSHIANATIKSADIAPNEITNDRLAWVASQTVRGRISAGSGTPEDLTMSQLTTMLALPTLTTNDTAKVPINTASGVTTLNVTNLATMADIAAGGGSGNVAADAIWDTKGDLAVGTGANTAAKLILGIDGQVLTADSAQTTGVKWATAGTTGDVYVHMLTDGNGGAGVANSTVQVADTGFSVSLAANSKYMVEIMVVYTADTGADIKSSLHYPTSATSLFNVQGWHTSTAGNTIIVTADQNNFTWSFGSSANPPTLNSYHAHGIVTTVGNAGLLEFWYAQLATSTTATIRKAGSYMYAKKLS